MVRSERATAASRAASRPARTPDPSAGESAPPPPPRRRPRRPGSAACWAPAPAPASRSCRSHQRVARADHRLHGGQAGRHRPRHKQLAAGCSGPGSRRPARAPWPARVPGDPHQVGAPVAGPGQQQPRALQVGLHWLARARRLRRPPAALLLDADLQRTQADVTLGHQRVVGLWSRRPNPAPGTSRASPPRRSRPPGGVRQSSGAPSLLAARVYRLGEEWGRPW